MCWVQPRGGGEGHILLGLCALAHMAVSSPQEHVSTAWQAPADTCMALPAGSRALVSFQVLCTLLYQVLCTYVCVCRLCAAMQCAAYQVSSFIMLSCCAYNGVSQFRMAAVCMGPLSAAVEGSVLQAQVPGQVLLCLVCRLPPACRRPACTAAASQGGCKKAPAILGHPSY